MLDNVTEFNVGDHVRVTNESILTGLGRPFILDVVYKVVEAKEVLPPGPHCTRWWNVWEDEPRTERTVCWGKEKHGNCHCEEDYECHPHQRVQVQPTQEDGSLWEGGNGSPSCIQISGEYLTKVSNN